jgi:hypothetical protein
MKEVVCASETSVYFYETAQQYISQKAVIFSEVVS